MEQVTVRLTLNLTNSPICVTDDCGAERVYERRNTASAPSARGHRRLPAQRSAYSLTIAESWTNSLLCMTVSDTINMKYDSLSLISEHTRWTHTITHTEESHMRSSDRHLITQLELKVIPEWLWISYSDITSAKAFESDESESSELVLWITRNYSVSQLCRFNELSEII